VASDLYYLRARYYDPESGRFLSQDPIRFPNRYAYAQNNPVLFTDPSGLCGFPGDCFGDLLECGLNGLDCVDPRRAADPLINLLPEGSFRIFGRNISYQLVATCVQYPEACASAARAMVEANTMTSLLYSEAEQLEGTSEIPKEGDAFQHCYWSGLITLDVGAGRAEKVTTRFEATGSGNDPDFRAYDLYNNQRGRDFARYLRASPRLTARAALVAYCRG
jgi:uncharacterized protein RhaS with RHS repeats